MLVSVIGRRKGIQVNPHSIRQGLTGRDEEITCIDPCPYPINVFVNFSRSCYFSLCSVTIIFKNFLWLEFEIIAVAAELFPEKW